MSLHPLDPRDEGKPEDEDWPIETRFWERSECRDPTDYGWYFYVGPDWEKAHGSYDTEADALFAARCALVEVEAKRDPDWDWWEVDGAVVGVGFGTRDAALCAAIDSRSHDTEGG